jgi:hypothetical protein
MGAFSVFGTLKKFSYIQNKNMGKLIRGSVIHTSYATGPYRVVGVTENCTCKPFWEDMSGKEKSIPHTHLELHRVFPEPNKNIKQSDSYHINYMSADSLVCVREGYNDYLICTEDILNLLLIDILL